MAAPNTKRDSVGRDPAPDTGQSPAGFNHDDGPGPGDTSSPVHNKERWRLAWRYGEMTDRELESLAADFASLTEVARRALESEMKRRGLSVESQSVPSAAAPSQTGKLVTVRTFRDMPEALLAKSVLESAGVYCALADANIIRTDWLWSNLLGGIKLRVQEEDLEAASNLLDQNSPELHTASAGDLPELACPRCGSLDISCENFQEPAATAGRMHVASRRDNHPAWSCDSCGHVWQELDPTA
jgi:membrane protease subunit (stomatin/prohibitin family)